ncbi:MAG: hypothetical protein HY718_12285 [Planctomycetes bacterium]|nr:hypothetical protein [Planctomycetota bacterium]
MAHCRRGDGGFILAGIVLSLMLARGAKATPDFVEPLPWPGRGHGNANPHEGFPNIHFWKEEAVVGNNYTNVQINQNGTPYDMYFPSAGCAQGVGTKNEGYVDGLDTFPPGLPLGYRGQMHVNQAQAGLRVDDTTYWLSNEGGAYSDHSQAYVSDTAVKAIRLTQAARTESGASAEGSGVKGERVKVRPGQDAAALDMLDRGRTVFRRPL